jgi:hypothetical protein
MTPTSELEADLRQLRRKMAKLQDELDVTESLLHTRYELESGLIGKTASSTRVPGGITIKTIAFKTWDPKVPQSVSGYRIGAPGTWTTIHVTSPGYKIYDSDSKSHQA